ncbi:MAG TPA: PLP-dependent aminotransferase family protein [Hyphomicrobium sp.]|jgi:DNA-binding transcriptional MocR family regulator
MDWLPTISDRGGPLYLRIVNALSDDIAAGRLHQGQLLPTHRALAVALGVDLTTVTRAYTEARRQGLTEARVGRGTFVKAGPAHQSRQSASPGIDLSMNLPPQPQDADLTSRLAKAFGEVRAESSLESYLNYQQPGGTRAERNTAADWLQFLVPGVASDRLIIAPGTQSALFCLLLTLTSPGDSVFTETLTYPGLKAAAAAVGVNLIGVEMDADGLDPGALERACQRNAEVKVVYLMPTMHNPTTATMPPSRRAQIAQIIRKHSLTLIEDDPYAFLTTGVTPLTTLIPERAYLTASLSKAITPGLRASLVVVPDQGDAARLISSLRATVQMPVPLAIAIVTRWMCDGSANAIIKAVGAEAAARQRLARDALAGQTYAADPKGHHVWLSLPESRSSVRFAAELQKRGLGVVTGDAFATTHAPPNCIRIALGAARNRPLLAKALEILRETLAAKGYDEQVV